MDFANELKELLENNKDKRIVVVGTTCVGKSTLLETIDFALDMDKLIFPLLTDEEKEFVCKPYTEEIGEYMDKAVKEKIKIEKGKPVFGTVVIDSDLIIYLDIEDPLLKERATKRNVNFNDAKRMNLAIKKDIEKSSIPCIILKMK